MVGIEAEVLADPADFGPGLSEEDFPVVPEGKPDGVAEVEPADETAEFEPGPALSPLFWPCPLPNKANAARQLQEINLRHFIGRSGLSLVDGPGKHAMCQHDKRCFDAPLPTGPEDVLIWLDVHDRERNVYIDSGKRFPGSGCPIPCLVPTVASDDVSSGGKDRNERWNADVWQQSPKPPDAHLSRLADWPEVRRQHRGKRCRG